MTLEQIQQELTENRFSYLFSEGPNAIFRCVCGEIFHTDATTEENLRYQPDPDMCGVLVPVCPNCGLNPKTGKWEGNIV